MFFLIFVAVSLLGFAYPFNPRYDSRQLGFIWVNSPADGESETRPKLGSLIVGESSGVVYEVIKVTKAGVVVFADTPDNVVGYYNKRDFLLFFKPIETTEEKAQREEDEFVVAI